MSVPRQSAVWDDSRNTSRLRSPSPTALPDCLAAFAAWRRANPAHAQWIADGYPTMTEPEHVQRFGEPYAARKPKR